MKRVISVLICVVVIISLTISLPMTASAADYPAYPDDLAEGTMNSIVRWGYANRQCTSFVAWCLISRNGIADFTNLYGGVNFGNGGTWGNAAKSIGLIVDMNPTVGSVAYHARSSTGHVAWVLEVQGDRVEIEEYNFGLPLNSGKHNIRTVNKSDFDGYIHFQNIPLTPPTISMTVTPSAEGPYISVVSTGTGLYYQLRKDGQIIAEAPVSQSSNDWNFSLWGLSAGTYSFAVQANRSGMVSEEKNCVFTIGPPTISMAVTPSVAGPYISVTTDGTILWWEVYRDSQLFDGGSVYGQSSYWNFSSWDLTAGDYHFRVVAQRNDYLSEAKTCDFVIEAPQPQTYTKQQWSENKHYYQVFDEALTWVQAKVKAEQLGGYLATITSQAEWDYVYGMLKPTRRDYYWFGGSDTATEGAWNWVTGEDWVYNNWGIDQPDNYREEEHWLHFYANQGGIWNDVVDQTFASSGYIVEWNPELTPSEKIMPGDVNDSGTVTIADVTMIYQHVRGKAQLTGDALAAADVNNSGTVTIADVTAVYQYVRGKITSF